MHSSFLNLHSFRQQSCNRNILPGRPGYFCCKTVDSITAILGCLLFFFCPVRLPAQVDYGKIFGTNWLKAEEFVEKNREWIKPMLDKYDIGFDEAMAIVFPELVRYSALRDKIEITLLRALYVNTGSEYADFSVGPFQMKPSFAERVLEFASQAFPPVPELYYGKNRGEKNSWQYRASVLGDLENIRTQLLYLACFIKICESEFELPPAESEERIAFLATAYNCGFRKTHQEIIRMQERKFFTDMLQGPPYYSYCDISVYWFKSKKMKLKDGL